MNFSSHREMPGGFFIASNGKDRSFFMHNNYCINGFKTAFNRKIIGAAPFDVNVSIILTLILFDKTVYIFNKRAIIF